MRIGNIPNAWSVEKKDDLGMASTVAVCAVIGKKDRGTILLGSGKCRGGDGDYIFLS